MTQHPPVSGWAKCVVFCNAPDDNPFMAGAFHGVTEADAIINVGVSGPGVVKKAIENVVTFSNQEESISWKEFLELDIIGDKKKRLKVYDLFHLGYGNAKTLFKRLNMVGISREMIEKELENEGYSD